AEACSFAWDYFYQVTNLRGTVVGSTFPFLSSFRWFRRSVARPQVKLVLYPYCWPCKITGQAPVKTVFTDAHGKFDFGAIRAGHYYLYVGDIYSKLSGGFQIEMKSSANLKQFETIDISPVGPDCSGGHELTVNTND